MTDEQFLARRVFEDWHDDFNPDPMPETVEAS